jgi:hypothetical protein
MPHSNRMKIMGDACCSHDPSGALIIRHFGLGSGIEHKLRPITAASGAMSTAPRTPVAEADTRGRLDGFFPAFSGTHGVSRIAPLAVFLTYVNYISLTSLVIASNRARALF